MCYTLWCPLEAVRLKSTSLYTYPRMHVIRATDICDGLMVDSLPSLWSSASSWFRVTNSASIATMSPVTHQFGTNDNNKFCISIVWSLTSKEVDFLNYYSIVCIQISLNTTWNFDDFKIVIFFIFNLITCIRTTSWSTDVQHITSLHQIAYVQRIRCIKIVLQISNCISRLRMARRDRNT
jgi:hypothetical protein